MTDYTIFVNAAWKNLPGSAVNGNEKFRIVPFIVTALVPQKKEPAPVRRFLQGIRCLQDDQEKALHRMGSVEAFQENVQLIPFFSKLDSFTLICSGMRSPRHSGKCVAMDVFSGISALRVRFYRTWRAIIKLIEAEIK